MLYKDFPVIPKVKQKAKLICGVGINDANYQIYVIVNFEYRLCPIYSKWHAMMKRCYAPSSFKYNCTYNNCIVDERWHSFMAFREWVLDQHEWEGLHLDKDLLIPGNKVYGPDTCLFVSLVVNNFLTFKQSSNSGLPIGVRQIRDRFLVQISIFNSDKKQWKSKTLNSKEEAALLYWQKKREFAYLLAYEQSDERVAKALINYFDKPEQMVRLYDQT